MEYKESFAQKIPDSVAAMANTYGGMILVGVTERNLDDRIIGVPESTIVQIVSACHQKLEPPWEPEIIPVPLPGSDGLMVLVVRVDPARAPRPLLIQGAAPIRLHGRNAVAGLPRLTQLITEAAPQVKTLGWRLPHPELPRDANGQHAADFLVHTGMFVPVDASATWSPLSESAVDAFAGALNNSPLHQALFHWCASLGTGGMNPFHRSGFNRARTVRLLWRGGPGAAEPYALEAVAKLELPASYGAPVSHLRVSLEALVRIGHALKMPSSPALAVGRLHDLVDSMVATLVDERVTAALATLAGVDPLVVPQPLSLDFVTGPPVQDLLTGNGLTPFPDAGSSHGANLLADPGVDQRDQGERRTLVDNWLQQISLDAGLRGMEQALRRLHATPRP
ncbi:ATP-binding protein [Streptacidiphilus neutrinimicus]|uniref:ATP-binding protein n=1 Tax=Streptacidiphilus neutrinimicus TaxID=105420 RepID=UPI00137738BE|nr:ATP-binding protein [Streptacidiphilus neutrinimicus]